MNMKKTKLEAVELPKDVSNYAQQSVDTAQAAFEKAGEVAHSQMQAFDASAGAFKSRALDLQMKAMEIAQINLNSGFAFLRKAWSIQDPTEFVSLNQNFVRDQFSVMSKQVSELNELSLQFVKETTKPVQEGVMKSFGDFSKSFAA
ncbi:hypothetical protein BH10PSE7_BH10PSE7_05240 [soil metagenome]